VSAAVNSGNLRAVTEPVEAEWMAELRSDLKFSVPGNGLADVYVAHCPEESLDLKIQVSSNFGVVIVSLSDGKN
jgi:UDP-N-acetyl-D-mannosaminuronate dehydrogenase